MKQKTDPTAHKSALLCATCSTPNP